MMFSSEFHAPNLSVNNANFRLALHRECERRFPLRITRFPYRPVPWLVRFLNFVKSLIKRVFSYGR